jgi:hypothetical protein
LFAFALTFAFAFGCCMEKQSFRYHFLTLAPKSSQFFHPFPLKEVSTISKIHNDYKNEQNKKKLLALLYFNY